MNAAVVGLVGTVIGGVIGAASTMASSTVEHRARRAEDRRRELVDLTSRLWDAADRWWRASQGLEHAVIGLTNAERSQNWPARERYEQMRQDSFRAQHEAELAGRLIAAQLRLLYPELAGPATALLDASETYDIGKRHEQAKARDAALQAYEQATQAALARAGRRSRRASGPSDGDAPTAASTSA